MEEQKEAKKCCWNLCKDGSQCKMHGKWIIKIIVVLVILGIVFSLGMLAGAAKVIRHSGTFDGKSFSGPFGMMGEYGMRGTWGGAMCGDERQKGNSQTIFGIITKIEGNEITIMDNGNKEVKIISSSNTTIASSEYELGLNMLEVGDPIRVLGVTAGEGQFNAQYILIRKI